MTPFLRPWFVVWVCPGIPGERIVGRRLTRWGAERKAERLTLWSLSPGSFYVYRVSRGFVENRRLPWHPAEPLLPDEEGARDG